MNRIIKRLMRWGIVGAAIVSPISISILVLVGGYLMYRSYSDYHDNKIRNSGLTPEQYENARRIHRKKARRPFFNRKNNQWDISQFPCDMKILRGVYNPKSCVCECAGVDIPVNVFRMGRRTEFSFAISDADRVQKISEYIEKNGIIGTRIERRGLDFEIVSDNAIDINDLVKQFYPPRSFKVERKIDTVRQYVVAGCASYEEAVEKVKNKDKSVVLKNTYTEVENTVNGVKQPVQKPFMIDDMGARLEPGVFFVDERTWDVYSKNIVYRGMADATDEALRDLAAQNYEHTDSSEEKVEDACSVEPKYENPLPEEKVERYVSINDREINIIPELGSERQVNGVRAFVTFATVEELAEALNDPSTLRDNVVILQKGGEAPSHENAYVLELQVDENLLLSMRARQNEVKDLMKKYEGLGVSEAQIHSSCILSELAEREIMTTRLSDIPDLQGSYVNDCPVEEFVERMSVMAEDVKFGSLKNEAQMKSWMEEASSIHSISLDYDLKNKEIVLTTDMIRLDDQGNSNHITQTDRFKMEEKDIMDFMHRKEPTSAELKDLAMKLYPSLFKTYSKEGEPVYDNPMKDYIAGVAPKTVKEVRRQMERKKNQQQKTTQQKQKKIKTNINKFKI